MIVGYGPIKKIALPFLSKEDEEIQTHLVQDLEQISLLTGPFMMTREFLQAYAEWYKSCGPHDGVDSDKFLGYNSRRALQLKKLSMIFSASESNEMVIHERHFLKALAALTEAEQEMPNAFYGVGRGLHSDVLTSIMRYVETKDTFTWTDVLKRFQLDAMPHDLERYLGILVDTNKLKRDISHTSTVYTVKHEQLKKSDNRYLKETLYRRMT